MATTAGTAKVHSHTPLQVPVVFEPGVVALEPDVRHLKHATVTFAVGGVAAAAVTLDKGFDGGQP